MKITKCRLCGCEKLKTIINLGYMRYTGVFPKETETDLGGGELELVKCIDRRGCGLVQLSESFEPSEMYGENYGYHSSLNSSMVNHLRDISNEIINRVKITDNDVILDIGSNDGTLLSTYLEKVKGITLVGIDPSGGKFRKYYSQQIVLIEDFFSANVYKSKLGEKRKTKVVTSIAMFYDLEDPVTFARDVESILDDEGVWVIEQSYLPLMIATSSYDTICHEHIEFYSLRQIEYIADKAGLKIIDVSINDTNGGSFRVTMCKACSKYEINDSVQKMRKQEYDDAVNEMFYFDQFSKRIDDHRNRFMSFLEVCKANNKLVLGYGASTKGNVVLQYCGVNRDLISAIVEVNSDKYGCVTPGTEIPIISEKEGKDMRPDYFVVLPWHFKENILSKEEAYRKETGVQFVFYLPEFCII